MMARAHGDEREGQNEGDAEGGAADDQPKTGEARREQEPKDATRDVFLGSRRGRRGQI